MGLGGALFERIEFEDGKILNPAFSRYRVPRFKDAPIWRRSWSTARTCRRRGPARRRSSASPRRSATRSSRRPASGCGRCRWCRTGSSRVIAVSRDAQRDSASPGHLRALHHGPRLALVTLRSASRLTADDWSFSERRPSPPARLSRPRPAGRLLRRRRDPRLDAAEGRRRHARLPRRHPGRAPSAAAASRPRSSGARCALAAGGRPSRPHLQPRRRLRLGRRPDLRRPDDHPRRPRSAGRRRTTTAALFRTWPRRGDGLHRGGRPRRASRPAGRRPLPVRRRRRPGRAARRRARLGGGRRPTCRPLAPRPRPATVAAASPTCRCRRGSRCSSSAAGTSARRSPGWRPRSDFDVWVLDDRERFASRERFPAADRLFVGDIGDDAARPRPAHSRRRPTP